MKREGMAACRKIECGIGTGNAAAKIDVTVAELDCDVRIDLISQSGVKRPRKIPHRARCGGNDRRSDSVAGREKSSHALIDEVCDLDSRGADTGADIRREAPPGSEIDIAVCEEQPFGLLRSIEIRAEAGGAAIREADQVKAVEIGVATILSGHVDAEPAVEPVAATEIEDASGIKSRRLVERCETRIERGVGVLHARDALIAEADVAAQIPATEIGGRRVHRRCCDRQVGRKDRRRHQANRSGGDERLHATHWLSSFWPVRRTTQSLTFKNPRVDDATKSLSGA